ncbi:MAG TPA: cytochrome c [Bryobacteraceae bacterium]|nr:cytochrome c [Bryobacteraceae bacterium]
MRAAPQGQSGKTVLAGVYTKAQAQRGQSGYQAHCANCHGADLSGYSGPPLKGDLFMDRWREFNLSVLFDLVKGTMPMDNPGSLGQSAYLDLTAYLLEANSIPAGQKDLTAAAVASTLLVGKDGPKPLPTSAQVAVIGCLTLDTGNGWFLTQATEPARTLDPWKTTAQELRDGKAKALGTQLFRLENLGDLPGFDRALADSKVEAKGILVRQPKNERINVTSLEKVDSACAAQ